MSRPAIRDRDDDRDENGERVLAYLYELPGPHGFGADWTIGRVHVSDALDELAATDGPISNQAARVAYEARIRERAARRAARGGES